MGFMGFYLICGLLLAFFSASLASARNQSPGLWFLLTLIFPIAILFIAMRDRDPEYLKKLKEEEESREFNSNHLSFSDMDASQKVVTIVFGLIFLLAALYAVVNS